MLCRSQSALHLMCNAVWDGFQVYTCFDTKSFRHKWKSIFIHILSRFDTNGDQFDTNWSLFKAKWTSRNTCIPLKVFSCSHRIWYLLIERMPSQKEKNHVCLEVLKLFTLAEYDELLLWNQPDSKGSQTNLRVEQIVWHRLLILSVKIL